MIPPEQSCIVDIYDDAAGWILQVYDLTKSIRSAETGFAGLGRLRWRVAPLQKSRAQIRLGVAEPPARWKEKSGRVASFFRAGGKPTPVFTPDMVKKEYQPKFDVVNIGWHIIWKMSMPTQPSPQKNLCKRQKNTV